MPTSPNTDARDFHARELARAAHRNYLLYAELSERESDTTLKNLFTDLAEVAKTEFSFWGRKGMLRADVAQLGFRLYPFLLLRRIGGAFFTTQFVLNREQARIHYFESYCADCANSDDEKAIRIMLERSRAIAGSLHTDSVHFFSELLIVIQSAFITTVSAVVGFSIILHSTQEIALITLLMALALAVASAASSYLHAEYGILRSPERFAAASGISYVIVALLSVLSFFFTNSLGVAFSFFTVFLCGGVALLSLGHSLILQRLYRTELFHVLTLVFGALFIALGVALFLSTTLHIAPL